MAPLSGAGSRQDGLHAEAAVTYGAALDRLAHAYEPDEVIRRRGRAPALVGLDELESMPDAIDHEQMLDDRRALDRMMVLIHRLDPFDRQVILRYLEGLDAASIGEITGISAGNVATKVHRVKKMLARRLHEGTP